MLELWIAFIIGIANVILLSYCARFWYRVWHKCDSPSAYAMAISCLFIVVLAIIDTCRAAWELLRNNGDVATLLLVYVSFTFLYAVIQLLFVRGYFSKGEVT